MRRPCGEALDYNRALRLLERPAAVLRAARNPPTHPRAHGGAVVHLDLKDTSDYWPDKAMMQCLVL